MVIIAAWGDSTEATATMNVMTFLSLITKVVPREEHISGSKSLGSVLQTAARRRLAVVLWIRMTSTG